MKDTRWYEVEGTTLCVYDAPYVDRSVSVSQVTLDQMAWYRAHFRMLKIDGKECPAEWR